MIEVIYNFIWVMIGISFFFSIAMIFVRKDHKKSINTIRKSGSFRELSDEEHKAFKFLYGSEPSDSKVYSFNGQVSPVYFDIEETKRVPDLIHVDGFPVTIHPQAIGFANKNRSSQITCVIHNGHLYAVMLNEYTLEKVHGYLDEIDPELVADRLELEILDQERLVTEDEFNALKSQHSVWIYLFSFVPLCLLLYFGLSNEIVLPTVVFSSLYLLAIYWILYSTSKTTASKQTVTKAKGKVESIRQHSNHTTIGFEHFEQTVEFQAPIRWAMAVNVGDIVEFETIQDTREMLSLKNEWFRTYDDQKTSCAEKKQWGFMTGFLMLSIIATSTINWSDIKIGLSLKDNKNVLIIDSTPQQVAEQAEMGQYVSLNGYRHCIVGENAHARCEFFGFSLTQPDFHFNDIAPGYSKPLDTYHKLDLYPLMSEGEYQFLASMALASAGKDKYKYTVVDRKANTYYDEYKLQELAQFVEKYCLTEIDCDRAKNAIISIWKKDSSGRCLNKECWADILNGETDFGFALMSKKDAEKSLGTAFKKIHFTQKRQLFSAYMDKLSSQSQVFVYLTSRERLYSPPIGSMMKKWSGDVNSNLTSTKLNTLLEDINTSSKIQTRGYITEIGNHKGKPVIHINTNIAESLKTTMLAVLTLVIVFVSALTYHLFQLWTLRRTRKPHKNNGDTVEVA
ncbi:hypothetical protein CW749_14560 [Vibrio sp. vnigr-6D03]|nr:hypothetical protein CW749_14560 [Vibrio sp. vnigr-6D03]